MLCAEQEAEYDKTADELENGTHTHTHTFLCNFAPIFVFSPSFPPCSPLFMPFDALTSVFLSASTLFSHHGESEASGVLQGPPAG